MKRRWSRSSSTISTVAPPVPTPPGALLPAPGIGGLVAQPRRCLWAPRVTGSPAAPCSTACCARSGRAGIDATVPRRPRARAADTFATNRQLRRQRLHANELSARIHGDLPTLRHRCRHRNPLLAAGQTNVYDCWQTIPVDKRDCVHRSVRATHRETAVAAELHHWRTSGATSPRRTELLGAHGESGETGTAATCRA